VRPRVAARVVATIIAVAGATAIRSSARVKSTGRLPAYSTTL
jgi:hypothetical protein